MRWAMVLRRSSACYRYGAAVDVLWRRRDSIAAALLRGPLCRRYYHSCPIGIPSVLPAEAAVGFSTCRAAAPRFMSVALPKSLKRTLRKKRSGVICLRRDLFYVDLGPSTWNGGPSPSIPCSSSSGLESIRRQQRLNWNPLSLGCRQLSVRFNTQPAQTPPTSPSKPSSSLLLASTVVAPTVPASSNARRAFLVDTLAVMRRLEAQELNQKQAEGITAVVTSVLNDSLESVAHSYTSKSDMQKLEMLHDASLSKFKAEMQSSLEHHFATLQRESERLRTDMEKMRSELRYEIDKVQANQRLDLNLERGHIRDELNKQQAETSNLTNKLDREIHGLKTQLEAGKYEVIKYCIGTIVSLTAVGLGLLRIIM